MARSAFESPVNKLADSNDVDKTAHPNCIIRLLALTVKCVEEGKVSKSCIAKG